MHDEFYSLTKKTEKYFNELIYGFGGCGHKIADVWVDL